MNLAFDMKLLGKRLDGMMGRDGDLGGKRWDDGEDGDDWNGVG